MADFDTAVQKLLRKEGGYVFNPNDPGGETNFGITKKSYPALDIKNLSKSDAAGIYRRDFWDPLSLNGILHQEIADQILDTAANMGRVTGAKIAQAAAQNLGKPLKVDGAIGPASIAAINAVDPHKLAPEMVRLRIAAYNDIVARRPASAEFLRGWISRAKSFGAPAAGVAGLLLMAAAGVYFIMKKRGLV